MSLGAQPGDSGGELRSGHDNGGSVGLPANSDEPDAEGGLVRRAGPPQQPLLLGILVGLQG